MKHKSNIFCLTIVIGFSLTSSAWASSIGVNFSGTANDGSPSMCLPCNLAPSETAGVIPQANWNNEAGDSGGPVTLVDNSGANTTALVSWSANNTWSGATADTYPGDNNAIILNNYLDGGTSGVAAEVQITNVPYEFYDLYVYIQRDDCCSFSDYSANGITQRVINSALSSGDGLNMASPTTGGSYVLFSGLTGNLDLLADLDPSDSRSAIDAIQLVPTTPVPEPSTTWPIALLGIGLAAAYVRKRLPN
ncbi:MAG TPA: PEP-CTERM sorting domain-containing protein [Bryobacteraceae bacterium]